MNDEQIERAVIDQGLTAARVTVDDINALMQGIDYHFHVVPATTTTVCYAIDQHGWVLAIGTSACVDPDNFNGQIGRDIAQQDATEKARERLWLLEGYHLAKTLRGTRDDERT